MTYQVILPRRVEKQLDHIPVKARMQISETILALAENPRPHGSIKLKGFADRYRIRVGDYRVIYQLNDTELIILVINVGNRKDIYR